MRREEIQTLALKALIENNGGTIVMDPGAGKSKVAIDFMKIIIGKANRVPKVLITSPRTNLKNNWKLELEKWGFVSTDTNRYVNVSDVNRVVYIDIENIQTAYKFENDLIEEYDLIIADEVHTMATGEYGSLITNAKRLDVPVAGLTGTPDDKKKDKIAFYTLYCPIVYRYLTAAEDNIINKRKIIVFEHELNDLFKVTIKTRSGLWSIGEKKQYSFIQSRVTEGENLIKDCLEIPRDTEEFVDYFRHGKMWYWNGDHDGDISKKNAGGVYMRAISARSEFLWNLTSTATYAQMMAEFILREFPDDKVLVFSERTDQAMKISNYSVHSKNKEEFNAENLRKFNEGIIRQLGSCNSLTLGLNMRSVKYAIMESYNSSNVQYKQKSGRVNRLPVDQLAVVTFISVKDTQVETWLNKALASHKDDIIKVSNMEDYYNVVREVSS